MTQAGSLVAIVDDDPSIRKALQRLLTWAGLETLAFLSAAAFLASGRERDPACLVLDFHDLPTREHARTSGAMAYLPKPFDDAALLEAVARALGRRP